MEAGQILIDKARHLDALLLAEWMMDRERFSYWFKWVLPFSPLFSRSQEEWLTSLSLLSLKLFRREAFDSLSLALR
jgi:hypothetical protein